MIAAVKNALKQVPFLRSIVRGIREPIRAGLRRRRDRDQVRKTFKNHAVYSRALVRKGPGTVQLQTYDGLKILIRQNLWDARIVREIFFDKPYVQHFVLPANPIVVDIGGYIGDFTLYAAKYLNAKRVIVYEPTRENFEVLTQNIANNGYADRITAVNKAVSDSAEITLNVQVLASEEVHVSAYWYQQDEHRRVPCDTLSGLVEAHRLDSIDLLKIDCEGGEYDILGTCSDQVYDKIMNIVFEHHQFDGSEARLEQVLDRLRSAGYTVRVDGPIAYASRATRLTGP